MSRLSELFDDVAVLMQFEEESQMEAQFEPLDKNTENRILEIAQQKVKKESSEYITEFANGRKKQSGFRKRKILFAVLAAAFLGTITVSAHEKIAEVIEAMGIENALREALHLEENTDELIVENIAESEDTVVEHSGVKVSIKQAVSDGEDVYVYLEVEIADSLLPEQWAAEGQKLYFRENELYIGGRESEKINFSLKQEDDGTIYGIIPFSLETIQEDMEISLKLNNLDFAVQKEGEKGWDIARLVEGEWNLNWELQCEKIAVSYEIDGIVDVNDEIVEMKRAVVSPLSVKVEGFVESDDPTHSQLSCYIYHIILKDGTLADCDYSYLQEKNGTITMKFYFQKMYSTDEIIGIVVNEEYIYFQ